MGSPKFTQVYNCWEISVLQVSSTDKGNRTSIWNPILVCFSDESTFEILQNKAQIVRRRGEKFHSDCVVQTVKHPTKIMIWPGISGNGTERLYVVEGMMRQDQYKDVLQNRLNPQLEEGFPNREPYIFMQDGAPCHTARSIKVFLAEQNIPLLDWSGNSPDMKLSKTFGS
ncbi:uncharacterized protein TNCV_3144751 [Trichonephila clavipes]|nr:uncharacterized protein TNCV_3144751 [Trichonephila clavipes]